MQYSKYNSETNKLITVYDLEDCLRAIRQRNEDNEESIKRLQEKCRVLEEEYSQDEEIQKMKAALKQMSDDYYRGFPISAAEKEAIDAWRHKHDEEVHGLHTFKDRLAAGGAIGGRYTYRFVPTSIGIVGTVECGCGATFEFQSL